MNLLFIPFGYFSIDIELLLFYSNISEQLSIVSWVIPYLVCVLI